jgi:hypothetical protein
MKPDWCQGRQRRRRQIKALPPFDENGDNANLVVKQIASGRLASPLNII